MIKGFAHNALTVTNMEESLNFYCDIAGLKKVFEIHNDKDEPWIVYLKVCDGQFLELFYNGVKDPNAGYKGGWTGYSHFCFEVDNIDELAKKFKSAGLQDNDIANTGKDHNKNCWIHDPDGNAVEFVQYMPDSPHMTL